MARLLRRTAPAGAVPYDFRRPAKLPREYMRGLQLSYETFGRRLGTLLTSGLRQLSTVNLVAIEHQTYEEYAAGLEPTTLMAVLDIAPLQGTAIFEMSVPTALGCLDYMLGGAGGEQPTRQLTDIEVTVLRTLLDQILAVLAYATEPTVGMTPTLRTLEYHPQFIQPVPAADTVVVASFEMRVGNQVCVATLCVPFASLQPRLQVGAEGAPQSAAERSSRERAARQVRSAMGNVPVDVSVAFRPLQLTPQEVIALVPGSVISLNHPVSTPLTVDAGGVTFAHALAGRQGTRLAGLVIGTPLEQTP
ncbi:flagellar motor switch protein FliM [Rhodococcus sp. X156]|uniref:flagellar motor switch protein FliM n=1 Tax=Rhodococcus sp. X156 TaxID=2499145 RepID=UPI000FDA5B9E|nr:flagellar motor switch protein FliM [Rhodococcus sp. X156]